jgi:hypothetical protein
MQTLKLKERILTILIILFLSACNVPALKSKPTESMETIQTAAAQTVSAAETGTAISQQTAAVIFTPVPTNTSEISITQTAFPTMTSYPEFTSTPSAQPVPCDRASFIADVTIPDGTVIGPNTTFTKTWRLKNDGSCTWTTAYKLFFVNGDAMNAPASVPLTGNVAPGQEVDLSVTFKSPAASGTYKSNWKLQNASGATFGLGDANQAFYVMINVGVTAVPFAVTSVIPSADPSTWNAACPFAITLKAKITATAAGTVTYFWERSDGAQMPSRSITFTEAGTQTITEELTGGFAGYTFDGYYRVYIDKPNHQYFTPVVNLDITCP